MVVDRVFICKSLSELETIAADIAMLLKDSTIVLFKGEMGAGKTTLIRLICKHYGVTDNVSSPTFSIVNEYHTATNEIIYHFDFYRINKISEVYDMGYEDYFYSGNKCFIEWPEKVESLINFKAALVLMDVKDEIRTINVSL
ncbi:MAG: tRNA (adenosine(37)-N6)-threonylcarbamoyltransferase complex ATPase subunit type 1 TsaE [Bacteroidetes bacterium]|jgi:tRNA threonylcarbamoyladenosine biosynthesis protein TsaE|nr:tRNA (adenosine(37)-N6)-threonylcarbamoyltransferase complex ATPase subunit type 1 TsaE [Bacteroidota bacterium]